MGALTALPALDLKPVQQPDILEKFGQLAALRNANQEYQQRQALMPIQQQTAQIGLQQQQQQLKNQQALTAAYQGWNPKDGYGTLAQNALKHGASGDAVQSILQHGLEIQKTASDIASTDATTGSKNAETLSKQLDMAAGELNGVLQVPPEQQGQALLATAQKLAQEKRPDGTPLLDQQHLAMAQQLAQNPQAIATALPTFAKSLTAFSAQLEDAQKQAQAQSELATAAEKNMNVARGGSTDVDKFESDYLKSKSLPDTPQNRMKAFQEYTRETKIQPAMVRVEGMAQTREMPVLDTKNGNAVQYLSAADINASNKNEPGRYVPAVEGAKALTREATIEDIRGNINAVRQNLTNPKMPEFNAEQRAAISLAIGGNDPTGALSNAFRGGVLGSLTPEQQDYLINMGQLKENAMAMRSVLGAGQGSEDLRNAITATIPGPRTPSKAYAAKQLDAFENVLNRLEKGVPKVPLGNGGSSPQSQPSSSTDPFAQFGGQKH